MANPFQYPPAATLPLTVESMLPNLNNSQLANSLFCDAEDDVPSTNFPKDGRTPRYNRTMLTKGTLYIVDDLMEAPTGRFTSYHAQKCMEMRKAFDEYTTYKVRSAPVCEEEEYLEYWRQELAGKAKNEMTVIFVEADAGLNGEVYSFFLRSAPGKLNAYNWLKVLSESEKNILLLIDGYLPSRFHGKKGLARDLECRAGLEIIACGRPGQNNNAEKAINPFVEQLILQMEDLIARAAKKTFRSRAALSLPQLLKRATLDNNPVRLWLSTCAPEYVKEDGETREKDKVVPRLRICPRYVKAHGKIAFHCDIIRDTKKARRATAAQRRAAKAKARASAEKGVAYHDEDEGFNEDEDSEAVEVSDDDMDI